MSAYDVVFWSLVVVYVIALIVFVLIAIDTERLDR